MPTSTVFTTLFAQRWYGWIGFAVFGLALIVALWVLFDSQRRLAIATLWRILGILAVVILLPTFVIALDARIAGHPLALRPDVQRFLTPIAYVGIAGGVFSLVTLLGYMARLGVQLPPPYLPPLSPIPSTQVDPLTDFPTSIQTGNPPPLQGTGPLPEVSSGLGIGSGAAETVAVRTVTRELGWFIMMTGPHTGREFRLGQVTNIGRDATQCDIPVDDPTVSRQHARVKLEDGSFVLYDLASTSGTLVGEEKILKHVLEDKDIIHMGDTTFTFIQVRLPERKS